MFREQIEHFSGRRAPLAGKENGGALQHGSGITHRLAARVDDEAASRGSVSEHIVNHSPDGYHDDAWRQAGKPLHPAFAVDDQLIGKKVGERRYPGLGGEQR